MVSFFSRIHLLTPCLWVLLSCLAMPAVAAVKVGSVFSNNMVLQRDMKTPIWGWADPGEKVTVSLPGQTQTAEADKAGHWIVRLDPLSATDKPFDITIAGATTLTIKNVLAGDVWLCSGQSNMARVVEKSLSRSPDPNGDLPLIRDFQAYRQVELEPQKDVRGRWTVSTTAAAEHFSGVGFYFARKIQEQVHVPVGILESSLGATNIEAWMSMDAFKARPEIKPFLDEWNKALADLPGLQAKFQADLAAWDARFPGERENYEAAMDAWAKAKADALTKRQPLPPPPPNPPNSPLKFPVSVARLYQGYYDVETKAFVFRLNPGVATGCFNGMILPILPYGIKGILWWQGENNVNRADLYRFEFPALIGDWRKKWGEGNDLPFFFVSLARYTPPQVNPVERGWGEMREAQTLTARAVPHTAVASAIDLGEANDIHASNKETVGHRLAACALALVYGQKLTEYEAPMYDSMTIEGHKVRLKFTHTGSGLMMKGDKLTGFAIAGADKKFVWGDAVIDGDTVLVSSAQVPEPKFVYYGWGSNPPVSLYNKEGFPTSSFRTDEPPVPSAN
jgi:sialate O-acetylesterase